jgi:hypothetical protein
MSVAVILRPPSSLSDSSKNQDFSEYYVHGSPEFIV